MRTRWPSVGALALGIFLYRPAAGWADALKSVGKQFAKSTLELSGRTVAVLPFAYPDGEYSSGSWFVSERLTTELANHPPIQVVERSRLPEVMAEMKLEISGAMQTQSAPPWGKLLSVDALIIGTLIDLGSAETDVHARLIDTRTGRILAARTVRVHRSWTDQPSKDKAPSWDSTREASDQESSGHSTRTIESLLIEPMDQTGLPLPDLDTLVRAPLLPPHILGIIRSEYTRHPSGEKGARALYALGIVCERRAQYRDAETVYHQLISEFPRQTHLVSDATGRLWALQLAAR